MINDARLTTRWEYQGFAAASRNSTAAAEIQVVRRQRGSVIDSLSWFDRRRAEQLADFDRRNPTVAALLRELNALYLFGTIGMEAVLRSDGSVLVSVDETWDKPKSPAAPWRAATPTERTASLTIGARRLPEVAQLLPPRSPTASDCTICGGTGRILQDIVCMDCGALGWVDPASNPCLQSDGRPAPRLTSRGRAPMLGRRTARPLSSLWRPPLKHKSLDRSTEVQMLARSCARRAVLLIGTAAGGLVGCVDTNEPGDGLRVENVQLIQGGAAALEIDATLVNPTSRPFFAEACGGTVLPTVELYRDGKRTDTWSAICLADRDMSPVLIPPSEAVAVGRAVQAYVGATYRLGVRYVTDRGSGQWFTVWAPAVEFR